MIKDTIALTYKAGADLLVSYTIGRFFTGPNPAGAIEVSLISVEAQIAGHWSEVLPALSREQIEALEDKILNEAERSGLVLEF